MSPHRSMEAIPSADAEGQLAHRRAQVGDHGLPGDGDLAFGDLRARALRQVYVDPRAEADHADSLAGADGRPLAGEADDAPRHQAGDLHHDDTGVAGGDDEGVSLVVLARL